MISTKSNLRPRAEVLGGRSPEARRSTSTGITPLTKGSDAASLEASNRLGHRSTIYSKRVLTGNPSFDFQGTAVATDSISLLTHGGLFITLRPVVVPNVVGLSRTLAETTLSDAPLRYVAAFPFDGTGDGRAASQTPAAGVTAQPYSVVRVNYPSPLGPLPDAAEQGPVLSGWITGEVKRLTVDNQGAWLTLFVSEGVTFEFGLYKDAESAAREVWMRRGAMLALAQRAFTGKHWVQINVEDWMIQSISILA